MSRTTKSTLTLARMAYDGAKRALPPYAHRFSPKKFSRPQLVAILCLKEARRQDYRGICQDLREWAELRHILQLAAVPHYSTLCKAAERLLGEKSVRRLVARHVGSGAGAGVARR